MQALDIAHYKADQAVLADGEEISLTTLDGITVSGKVKQREASAVTLVLPSGNEQTFPVEEIAHFQSSQFSVGKTAGLVAAVTGGLALIWVIVATITIVSVLVALPVILLG